MGKILVLALVRLYVSGNIGQTHRALHPGRKQRPYRTARRQRRLDIRHRPALLITPRFRVPYIPPRYMARAQVRLLIRHQAGEVQLDLHPEVDAAFLNGRADPLEYVTFILLRIAYHNAVTAPAH